MDRLKAVMYVAISLASVWWAIGPKWTVHTGDRTVVLVNERTGDAKLLIAKDSPVEVAWMPIGQWTAPDQARARERTNGMFTEEELRMMREGD